MFTGLHIRRRIRMDVGLTQGLPGTYRPYTYESTTQEFTEVDAYKAPESNRVWLHICDVLHNDALYLYWKETTYAGRLLCQGRCAADLKHDRF
jgi:hypothetical protein